MPDYLQVPIDRIDMDPHQVRQAVREESLDGLAQSVREVGVLHPILVTPTENGRYRLISGERRLRAASRAGETAVPALVVRAPRGSVTQIQLIENLQREDLNPIERALAIRDFMAQEGLSKAAAAARLGVPRTTLTDWLDVLDLDERHQAALLDNSQGGESPLTLSHVTEARALAARLGSPGIAGVLLDAVLEHRLSKAETRAVAQVVRDNANVNILQAVRMVKGRLEMPAGPRHRRARQASSQGAEQLPDDGACPAEAAETGTDVAAEVAAASERGGDGNGAGDQFGRLVRALDRFRLVLSAIVGGALERVTPAERSTVIQYLETMRRWIDEAIGFARELDQPELAEERRRLMRMAAKEAIRRARRRKRGRGAGVSWTAVYASPGSPLTPPGAGLR